MTPSSNAEATDAGPSLQIIVTWSEREYGPYASVDEARAAGFRVDPEDWEGL